MKAIASVPPGHCLGAVFSSRNLKCPHRVPFTKEKMPKLVFSPLPFQKQSIQAWVYRPIHTSAANEGPVRFHNIDVMKSQIHVVWMLCMLRNYLGPVLFITQIETSSKKSHRCYNHGEPSSEPNACDRNNEGPLRWHVKNYGGRNGRTIACICTCTYMYMYICSTLDYDPFGWWVLWPDARPAQTLKQKHCSNGSRIRHLAKLFDVLIHHLLCLINNFISKKHFHSTM